MNRPRFDYRAPDYEVPTTRALVQEVLGVAAVLLVGTALAVMLLLF